jgi:uncharacterized delta-60 repeat protein
MKKLFVIFCLINFQLLFAQQNFVDQNFGYKGNVLINLHDTTNYYLKPNGTTTSAILSDGKILLSFFTDFLSPTLVPVRGFGVFRIMPDGKLDSSFGTNGVKQICVGPAAYLKCLKLLPDGKILLCGDMPSIYGEGYLALVRLLPDGEMDSSYNGTGINLVKLSSFAYSLGDMISRQDGKHLAIGWSNGNLQATLMDPNGTIDSTFGTNGTYSSHGVSASSSDGVSTGFFHPDNSITLCTNVYIDNGLPKPCFIKLTVSGKADSTFGSYGIYVNPLLNRDRLLIRVLPAANDKFYLGYYNNDSSRVCRFFNDGRIDSAFGMNGSVRLLFNGVEHNLQAMELREDSLLVLKTYQNLNGNIIAMKANGTLDQSFGTNGVASFKSLGISYLGTFISVNSKNIYVYDIDSPPTLSGVFQVLALTKNGQLDSSLQSNGYRRFDFGGSNDYLVGLNTLSDGKLLVSGWTTQNAGSWFFQRYYPNGRIDSNFGVGGTVVYLPNPVSSLQDIVVLPDNSIIGAGSSYGKSSIIRKLKSSGSVDSTFGNNGIYASSDWLPDYVFINKIDIQQDGKILYAGRLTDNQNFERGTAIIGCLAADGKPDITFGVNGRKIIINPLAPGPYTLQQYTINTILSLGEKKMLTAATVYNGTNDEICEFRQLKENGNEDSSFGVNGLVYYTPVGLDRLLKPLDMVRQPDGKIIVLIGQAGTTSTDYSGTRLVRYHPKGTLDSSFGLNGTTFVPGISHKMLLQKDGRILVGQEYLNNQLERNQILRCYRFKGDGNIDSTFGFNGLVTLEDYFTVFPHFNDLVRVLLSVLDSNIVIGGTVIFRGTDARLSKLVAANEFPSSQVQAIDTLAQNCGPLQIFWRTTDEINSKYFDIERSSDSNDFRSIARIAASGNSSGVKGYSYTILSADTSFYYYRVRLWSNAGSYLVSNSIKRRAASAAVSITSSSNNICSGDTVNFTSSVANAGTAPIYHWQINGLNTGANASSFSSTDFKNGDSVKLVITGNDTCSTIANSNVILMHVTSKVAPTITISSTGCVGDSIIFNAVAANLGNNGTIEWFVDNMRQGIGSTFLLNNAKNGIEVYAKLNSTVVCADPQTVNSSSIKVNCIVTALPVIDALESFAVSPNPTTGTITVKMKLQQLKKVTFRITDLNGKSVYQSEPVKTIGSTVRTINLNGNAPGVYYLQTCIGSESFVNKLLVICN